MIYRESKVYFDGSHYIAIPHTNRPPSSRRKPVEEIIEVRQEQTIKTVEEPVEPVRDEAKEVRTVTADSDFSDDEFLRKGACISLPKPRLSPLRSTLNRNPKGGTPQQSE